VLKQHAPRTPISSWPDHPTFDSWMATSECRLDETHVLAGLDPAIQVNMALFWIAASEGGYVLSSKALQ